MSRVGVVRGRVVLSSGCESRGAVYLWFYRCGGGA